MIVISFDCGIKTLAYSIFLLTKSSEDFDVRKVETFSDYFRLIDINCIDLFPDENGNETTLLRRIEKSTDVLSMILDCYPDAIVIIEDQIRSTSYDISVIIGTIACMKKHKIRYISAALKNRIKYDIAYKTASTKYATNKKNACDNFDHIMQYLPHQMILPKSYRDKKDIADSFMQFIAFFQTELIL